MSEEPKSIYDLEAEYFQILEDAGGHEGFKRRYEIVKTMEKMPKIPGTEMAAYKLWRNHLNDEARKDLGLKDGKKW